MKEVLGCFIDYLAKNWIGIITLIVAGFTLCSQRKTQRNTKSLVQPREAITSYLSQCYTKFLFIESYLYCIERYISKYGNSVKSSEVLSSGLKLDINDFNINMFYEDQSTYSSFSQFKETLSQLNDKLESLNSDLHNSSFNKEQLNIILSDTKNALLYTYYSWYALFIHAINYRTLSFWSRFLIDKLVYRIKLKIKYRKYEKDNKHLSFIERHAMDVQERFEKTILLIIDSSGWNIAADMYKTEEHDGTGLLEDEKTLTYKVFNGFYDFWRSKIILEIYPSSKKAKVEWDHYILHLINDEKRKTKLWGFLDAFFYTQESRFNKMITQP